MSSSSQKFSLFHVLATILSLVGLIATVVFYWQNRNTPQGAAAIIIAAGVIILSVVLRIAGFVFKLLVLAALLALGFLWARQHFF